MGVSYYFIFIIFEREREVYYSDIVVTEQTATHKNSLSTIYHQIRNKPS